jgi:hypothetical protein
VRSPFSIGLALLLGACGNFDTGTVATQRAAALLGCDESQVELTQLGAYRYRGEGCGNTVTIACTASALEPQCLEETAGGEVAAVEEVGEAPEEAPAPSTDGEIEAHVRAGLEARRDDVLACVGAERAAVRAAYAPDGSVEFTLQGTLHDSPEERCVADALDGLRVAPDRGSGVVVHLVR